MSNIINSDASVLGDLTINPANEAGDIVTINTSNVVTFRTITEIIADLDLTYEHDQSIASATWNVNHGLNKKPAILVVDSADTVVVGQIDYTDNNNVVITFNAAFSGYAYFN